MSRLLLDTHTIVWWDSGSAELGAAAKQSIRTADAVYVSAASEWELSIKSAVGKFQMRRSLLDAVLDSGFEPLDVSLHHAQAVRDLKPIHKDPFDRMLVAVALVESLTLVSSDHVIARYPIRVIDARR